jgi:hypothetical protein
MFIKYHQPSMCTCVCVCVTQKLFTLDDADDDASMSVEARVGGILTAQLWLKVVGIRNKLIEYARWYAVLLVFLLCC